MQAPGGPAAARRLWWAAWDQRAELRFDSALALLRAATLADPSFFPAQRDLLDALWERGAVEQARAAFPTSGGVPGPLGRCMATVAASFPTGRNVGADEVGDTIVARLGALDRRAASVCTATYLLEAAVGMPAAGLEYARRATRQAPELWAAWARQAVILEELGRYREADGALRQGMRRATHPYHRTLLAKQQAALRRRRGDLAGAMVLERAVEAAAARDGRPGILIEGMYRQDWAQVLPLFRTRSAWPLEIEVIRRAAGFRLDHGDPAAALPLYHRQVALADSVGSPIHQLIAYMQRGRAYSKLGRLAEAERDLRRALAAGRLAPNAYYVGESWHNLAHVYEAQGRMVAASRAIDRFTASARLRGMPNRLMSFRDAGLIRWRAGWHAAARAAFEAMVREVDARDVEHYWAGEYYERIGDLARARDYYLRSLGRSRERADQFRGLARVYEQLGYLDSAEAMAREHDARSDVWTPLEMPLVPAILARRGRTAEAVMLSRRWADRQLAGGNVQGAAVALLQTSEYLLASDAAAPARDVAMQAERLASQLNLTDELIGARRLQGLAWLRLRRPTEGVRALEDAARLALAHPTMDGVLATHLALAEALAASGRRDAALTAYDRAARAVEGVTERLPSDRERVGYRERHLLPFDGAVALLLERSSSGPEAARLVSWIRRRKAAALALATGERLDDGPAGRGAVAEVQHGLDAHDALVDFEVLRDGAAAIVVRPGGVALVQLGVAGDSLRRLVERLRAPLTRVPGRRIDLAHAPFDVGIAHQLYRLIWNPLRPHLSGVRRVWVVPDAALHLVPFEALVARPGRDYQETAYLIDDHDVGYLPTARSPASGAARIPGATRILAFVRDAPGGRQEMDGIVAAWPRDRVTVLTDGSATESAARRPPADILHFATHAEGNGGDAFASHLRLSADQVNDGYLHVVEIAAERRRARLVVLSACETITGPLSAGEGMMGLARAFLVSGAGAVVATHWPVGAASADVMQGFYRQLAAGAPPVAALREAKLALRHRRDTAHPFHWAAFVLIAGNRAT